jgi:hypothetical protein
VPTPNLLVFTPLAVKAQAFAPVPSSLSRARIPGGWLVYGTTHGDPAVLVFVPDPDHTWDGSSLP